MTENENNNEESFNKAFCDHLEYHLCRTFKNAGKDELRWFWCDGGSWHPIIDTQITKKV